MTVVIKARQILVNQVLNRRQMVLEVVHSGRANVPKAELQEILAKKLKTDVKNVVLYGFKTHFGGGHSTGFALVYDSQEYLLKYEPKFRLRRAKILPARVGGGRKPAKELKRKIKRSRAAERAKIVNSKKGDKRAEIRKIKSDYLKAYETK